jgi:hypothetical protein
MSKKQWREQEYVEDNGKHCVEAHGINQRGVDTLARSIIIS